MDFNYHIHHYVCEGSHSYEQLYHPDLDIPNSH